jgi:hypothetical protein
MGRQEQRKREARSCGESGATIAGDADQGIAEKAVFRKPQAGKAWIL